MGFGKRKGRLQDDPVAEKAAWWALRGDDAELDPGALAARDAWLAGAPERAEAYRKARSALALLGAHAAKAEIMELRQTALAARRETGQIPLARAAAILLCVVAVGVTAIGGWIARQDKPQGREAVGVLGADDQGVYRTKVGERSTFSLPDGSVVTLDTDSMVKVDYSSTERAVRLLKGQALFEVAKNKAIPFQAYAGDRRITAIGTLFDVRLDLDLDRVRVALLEGKVLITQMTPSPHQPEVNVTMTPGEMLDTGAAQPMLVKMADRARVDSWKDGMVVFEDDTLAAAVAELNRYNSHPIQLADPAIGALKVSGLFKTGDSLRFAKTMTEIFPLRLSYGGDGSLLLHASK